MRHVQRQMMDGIPRFRVGDEVRVIHTIHDELKVYIGNVGIVTEIDRDRPGYTVPLYMVTMPFESGTGGSWFYALPEDLEKVL